LDDCRCGWSKSPESREIARFGDLLRDHRIGREMSSARSELLGSPTAPPDHLNGTPLFCAALFLFFGVIILDKSSNKKI
jgi:hypothetical protein